VQSFDDFMKTLDIKLPKRTHNKKYVSNHMKLEPDRQTILKKAYDIMMNVIVYGAVLHNKT
jgi:F0F1-type ATP synthase gamma subunit